MRNVGSTKRSPQLIAFIRVKFSILELNSCAPVNFSMSAYLPTGKKTRGSNYPSLQSVWRGLDYGSALDKGKDCCFHLTALTKSVLMVRLCFIVGQLCAERPEAVTGQLSNNYRNICCELGNTLWDFSRKHRNSSTRTFLIYSSNKPEEMLLVMKWTQQKKYFFPQKKE